MTFLEAAIQVLRSSRRPLTTREVTERALEAGLIDTHGKTPNATMAAVLYRALHTDGELIKIDGPGNGRAKRGSVRWAAQKTGAKVLYVPHPGRHADDLGYLRIWRARERDAHRSGHAVRYARNARISEQNVPARRLARRIRPSGTVVYQIEGVVGVSGCAGRARRASRPGGSGIRAASPAVERVFG
jgi:hypothetical protein